MSGQGQVAKSAEIDVTKDETVENKDLVSDVESVTVEDPNKGKVNQAAITTKSTPIEEAGMTPQETVAKPPPAPETPVPAKMETKSPPPPPPLPPMKEKTPPPEKEATPPPPPPKKATPPPPPPKKATPPKDTLPPLMMETPPPAAKALKASQDLMQGFDVATTNTGMCVGYFKVKGSDASVLAACAKAPDNTCPATFSESACVALKPVSVDVTKGAKVMMF